MASMGTAFEEKSKTVFTKLKERYLQWCLENEYKGKDDNELTQQQIDAIASKCASDVQAYYNIVYSRGSLGKFDARFEPIEELI